MVIKWIFSTELREMGDVRVGVLGVRLRKEALTRRNNALFSAKQPAGRNSQKNTENLVAIPNQRIKKRKSAFEDPRHGPDRAVSHFKNVN